MKFTESDLNEIHILYFHLFLLTVLRLEEEYWDYTVFYDSKCSIEILQFLSSWQKSFY